MLIIKTKNNLPREKMKMQYKNFLEQMQLGLIFCNDEYDITVVEPFYDWIQVDESLPKDSCNVLATDGEDMFIAWRMNGRWCSNDIIYFEYTHPITAWMPLPEKYKEKEDKNKILNKIIAEIKSISPKTYPFLNSTDRYVKEDDVLQIINKYNAAESEE